MRDMVKKKANDARHHAERMKRDLRYRMRKLWNTINHRCNTDKHVGSRYYHERGIKNLLTVDELIFLWERDRAYHYKRPSIDRIDSKGHYELANCRFIELSLNVRRGWLDKQTRTASIMAGKNCSPTPPEAPPCHTFTPTLTPL